jgi:hypothetical protein
MAKGLSFFMFFIKAVVSIIRNKQAAGKHGYSFSRPLDLLNGRCSEIIEYLFYSFLSL